MLIEGKVKNDTFTGGLRVTAEKLFSIGEARSRFAKALHLSMNGGSKADKLRSLLAPYRNAGSGGCPVLLSYRNNDAEVQLGLSDAWRVRLDDALLADLHAWLSAANVRVVYS